MAEQLTSDERNAARLEAEFAIQITLKAANENIEAIHSFMGRTDLPFELIHKLATMSADIADTTRVLRDECEMSIRADGWESLELIDSEKS